MGKGRKEEKGNFMVENQRAFLNKGINKILEWTVKTSGGSLTVLDNQKNNHAGPCSTIVHSLLHEQDNL